MTQNHPFINQIKQALVSGKGTHGYKEVRRIERYIELVIKWGARINISGYKDKQALLNEYVVDTMRLLKYIRGNTLVDIGSGAGVPGLVLGIVCPDLKVVLTEKRLKRISFLKRTVAELELEHRIRVLNPDKDKIPIDQDMAALRAVTGLKGSLELGCGLTKKDGRGDNAQRVRGFWTSPGVWMLCGRIQP
jgi:16S rRNA (guanine527-N7)-methyltransferase